MLPVAFTCPLWWVARWATRVLTSLAVVAALALGAGPATAATPALSATSAVSATPAVDGAVAVSGAAGPLASSGRHEVAQVAGHPDPVLSAGVTELSAPTWSVDSFATPPGDRGPGAAGVLPVCPAGADRLPHTDGPRRPAPRGPPGR